MEQCKLCNKKSNHLENHHIIPKARGGKDTKENLIKICSECHSKAHDVSFTNERGGLIKERIIEKLNINKLHKEWLKENERLVNFRLNQIYKEDEEKWNYIMYLLKDGNFGATNLYELCIEKKTTVKYKKIIKL
jgi:hypothetical protein